MRKDVQASGRQDPCRGFAPLIWHLRPAWNLEPAALPQSDWLEKLGGEIVLPTGARATCSQGQGIMYDYAVVKKGTAHPYSIHHVFAVPWSPHCGLHIDVRQNSDGWWHTALLLPRALPVVRRPRLAPDPGSKISRARRACTRDDPQEPAGPDMEPDQEPPKVPFYAPDDSW
eukprot:9487345-Pyramimonas_sp.AAC.1